MLNNNTTQTFRPRACLRRALLVMCGLVLVACSDGNDNDNDNDNTPFQEIIANGIDRYLGEYTPMMSDTSDGVVTHTFGTGDGPLCIDGSSYRMSTRDMGSEDLIIFLQGGGACWSTFCAATENAAAGLPAVGLLDPNRADNPVRDWNLVYLPYCDGGLHSSDKDNDYDNDGNVDTPQRGLHNLSAALDVAVNTFPAPRRILLAGASAGGFGTTFALPLVRYLYPDVPIDVVNDSGVGVGRPNDRAYLELLMSDWNQSAFIPDSCDDCLGDDGHLTSFLIWQLDQDPNVRRSILSSKQDDVIGTFFLQIGGPAYEAALIPELMELEAAHPDRVRYWLTEGDGHTYVQLAPEQTAGGVSALDWVKTMLDDNDSWTTVSD